MAIAQTLIARAGPHMLAVRIKALIHEEASKGCCFAISPSPVALEPRYRFISQAPALLQEGSDPAFSPEAVPLPQENCYLQIWISPEEGFSWHKSELFLKQLRTVAHRMCFEIVGNEKAIYLRLRVHCEDLPIVRTSFQSQYERCELSISAEYPGITGSWTDNLFWDFSPPPPYSHLLTRPDELKTTTFCSLISAMMAIESPAFGFYQAVFQPADPTHDWHRNVQVLQDLEYALKLHEGIQMPQRYVQQAPSGDLRQMSWQVETKAHNDKPFYFVAIRLGVSAGGPNGIVHLKALSTFMNLFQHGGHPFGFVGLEEYRSTLSSRQIAAMLNQGLTHRPGFLVNSSELVGFVHIPPAEILEHRKPPLLVLETLPVRNKLLLEGTPIGVCVYAGVKQQVCIPPEIRSRSTHIVSKPDQGKSTLMARMILDDIEKGMGVAVIDPHGDLIEDLLRLIGEHHIDRTIYFDPGCPDFVPLWNPLTTNPGQSVSRTADNLVSAFKTVVTGWGDRLEHLLRNGLFGLLQLPGSTFLDLANLLRRKTDESKRLQKAILNVVDNDTAYEFWKNDFGTYSKEALGPPMHKLSKLLLSDRSSLMLSQPTNRIDFREIMDSGQLLLINLSSVGPEEREILGCFILSLLHLTALSRSNIALQERKQFHIHVDEAHRFVTEAIDDLVAEARKFRVSLNLAHQYLSQFGTRKIDALSSVGTTIIMNVDTKDAAYLAKDLQGLVAYQDLITLTKGEGVARIGTDIVKFRTPGALKIPQRHHRDAILKRSFERYYKPAKAIRAFLRNKGQDHGQPIVALTGKDTEEFKYEEF